jgi:NAD(P)-dependent dehydrogenase (short-subunit alcohol dehydrogenase family)
MRRFDGRVALVTGASRGIGFAIARRLVDEGAKVCITARQPDGLEVATAALGGPGLAVAVPGKADDPAHQAAAVAGTIDAFGRLDILVNNTGINPVYGPVLDIELSAARKIFEVNVLSAISLVQHAHRSWLGDHGGALINIASVGGFRPAEGLGVYGASKAAMVLLTEQLAVELGPKVRVNAVAPAVVRTRFASALYEGREQMLAESYPLKRLGEPEDVASAAAFLASDEASWITGHTIVLDGGLTLAGGV